MKKFSLLALVAVMVMAFAGAAFATNGDVTLSTSTAYTTQNNGIVSTDKSTNLYYFGGTAAPDEFELGVDIAIDGGGSLGSNSVQARWSKASDFTKKVEVASAAAATLASEAITVADGGTGKAVFATDDTLQVGTFDASAWVGTPATLKIVPTEVVIDATTPITKAGATDLKFKTNKAIASPLAVDLKAGDLALEFGTALEVYNGTAKVSAAVDGMTFTGTTTGMTISGTPTKTGTYTLTLKTDASEASLKIKEKDETTKQVVVKVAENELKAKNVATIVITVADYTVTPESATWAIGTSDDVVVSFDVDMAGDDFAGVSNDTKALLVAADFANTATFATSNDVNVEKKGADDIQVGIKKEFFDKAVAGFTPKSDGSISETIKLKVVDKTAKSVDITLNFTKAADPVIPTGVVEPTPTAISADLANIAGVQGVTPDRNFTKSTDVSAASGIATAKLLETSNGVILAPEYLSSDKMVKAFNDAGKWGNVDLTKSPDVVTSFQVVSVDVANAGDVAAIAYRVQGDKLVVSNDVNVENLNIYKVLSDDKVKRLSVAASKDNETSADLMGKYRVYTGSTANKATKVQRSGSYTLVVFVKDNGDLDLNSTAKQIVDPVVTVKSNPGGSSSSSSTCDAGFGLAAVAGLAALALRKRSK